MKKLLLLGASGSIGQQTIDLLINKEITYDLVGFSVGKRTDYIDEILPLFNSVKFVYLIDDEIKNQYQEKYPNITFYSEKDGFEKLILDSKPDLVVNALVGFVGVIPSIVTIENNIDLALANKESLVVAGEIINDLLKKHKVNLLPIDSEHVAIEKCIRNVRHTTPWKLVLTCSGGPFRLKKLEELKNVTRDDALKHPTWKMGNKITIDSATLINKVFEIIEAHYLFGHDFDHIDVMIHPQSLIHSMVYTEDGDLVLDYGKNDMRIPIKYALTYRSDNNIHMDQFHLNAGNLELYKPNEFQSNVLQFARYVLEKKGNTGCILNAANDFLVAKFLNNEIKFLDIYKYLHLALDNVEYIKNPNLKDIISTNNIVKYYLQRVLEEDK